MMAGLAGSVRRDARTRAAGFVERYISGNSDPSIRRLVFFPKKESQIKVELVL